MKEKNPVSQFLSDIDPIVLLLSVVVGSVVFLFATFTTFGYVDAKHESVMGVLSEIRDSAKITEQRVFEMYKERK